MHCFFVPNLTHLDQYYVLRCSSFRFDLGSTACCFFYVVNIHSRWTFAVVIFHVSFTSGGAADLTSCSRPSNV